MHLMEKPFIMYIHILCCICCGRERYTNNILVCIIYMAYIRHIYDSSAVDSFSVGLFIYFPYGKDVNFCAVKRNKKFHCQFTSVYDRQVFFMFGNSLSLVLFGVGEFTNVMTTVGSRHQAAPLFSKVGLN